MRKLILVFGVLCLTGCCGKPPSPSGKLNPMLDWESRSQVNNNGKVRVELNKPSMASKSGKQGPGLHSPMRL